MFYPVKLSLKRNLFNRVNFNFYLTIFYHISGNIPQGGNLLPKKALIYFSHRSPT